MEQRTVQRFRKRAILIHWLHATSSAVLIVTGAIMFFDLTDTSGGQVIRLVHRIAAAFFVIVPVLFSILDPGAALSFAREAFRWDRDNLAWLKAAIAYYFGRRAQMPAQGYLNGDQRLWQLVVLVTGIVFALSGILLWFFKLKMPLVLYQAVLLTHATSLVIVSFMFLVHFYLATLHPRFEESLSAMVDGKVSVSYAQDHYGKWLPANNPEAEYTNRQTGEEEEKPANN